MAFAFITHAPFPIPLSTLSTKCMVKQSVVCFTRAVLIQPRVTTRMVIRGRFCCQSLSMVLDSSAILYSRSILLPIPLCSIYGSHFVGWYKDGAILPCRISCHNHLSDPILPQTSLSYTGLFSHPTYCTLSCTSYIHLIVHPYRSARNNNMRA